MLKVKDEKDFWSGALFVVVGVAFAYGATAYRFGTSARPGAGFFPFGLGLLLAALGAGLVVRSLLRRGAADRIGAWPLRPALTIAAAVAAFGAALETVGLVVAVPLLAVVVAGAGPEFRWREAVVAAAVLTAFCWLVFVQALNLPLPLLPAALVR